MEIFSDNGIHVLIIMACSSSVTDEKGNIFRIEGSYH
jgi:hypothetical protein